MGILELVGLGSPQSAFNEYSRQQQAFGQLGAQNAVSVVPPKPRSIQAQLDAKALEVRLLARRFKVARQGIRRLRAEDAALTREYGPEIVY